ncbi:MULTISPECIES: hypothetical protein [unclassified Synechococcus]|uniref:hypothetical protein n=1 Tax=unclassified Synechococcus TaxID=2626047 RepID=UPI0039B0E037
MNDVFETKDKILFLEGGNHSVFELFSEESFNKKEKKIKKNASIYARNLKSRKRHCEKLKIPFINLIFPDKCVAFSQHQELLPYNLKSLFLDCYLQQYPDISTTTEYLLKELADPNCWLKTDTHLSPEGRIAATKSITSSRLLFDQDQILLNKRRLEGIENQVMNKKYIGDLGRKLVPPCEELIKCHAIYSDSSLFKKANNGISSGNEGIIEIIASQIGLIDSKLLIFGDSFMRQQLESLSLIFNKIIFMRTRYFHDEIVSDIRPDFVITSCAERYLSSISPDSEAPNFYYYPYLKRKALNPSPSFFDLWEEILER